VDSNGICLKVNLRLCEILDCPESRLLGPGFKRIISTKEPALNERIYSSISRGNSKIHYEEKICLRSDGEKIWIRISVSFSIDCENNSPYFIYHIEDLTPQKEVERALVNVEKKFKGIFENANDGITINDLEGRFLKVNNLVCKRLGYSEKELLRKKGLDIITSSASNSFAEQLRELYRCGYVVAESEVVLKNGSFVPIELSMSFIEYRGKPAILSIIRDIRERKKAEKMLKCERDSAQNYLDIAGTIIIAINEDQKVTLINKKGSELLGYPKKEIIGKNWFDSFIPARCRKATKEAYTQLMSGSLETFERLENSVLTRSGEERIIRWHNSIPIDNEGKIIGTLSSGEDITELKKAEENMRIRSVAMDSSLNAIAMADTRGNITYVNSAFLKLWGHSIEDIIGRSVMEFGVSEFGVSERKTDDIISALFSEGSWKGELDCRRKDNTDFYVHLSANLVKDEAGNPICMMGSLMDMSGHKEAEHMMIEARLRAEDANRAKSNFLASMSHELRTPLNSVIGFADVLKEKTFGPLNDRQAKYLNNISISGRHLLRLIDDILDLSKVEAGKMELNPEEFSVSETFREIETVLLPLAIKRNIKMVWETEKGLKSIRADRTKFKQILYNLIDNAIKFSPENGLIEICTEVSENNFLISVTDSGRGICIADQKKLFEPFTQLDRFESREQPGTGLGLVIVKKYVEMHGGKVKVESRIGEGSKFSFTIPLFRK
jgi:PAS domain S-box-containing protein